MPAAAGASPGDVIVEEKVVALRQVRLLQQPAGVHGLPHPAQRVRPTPAQVLHHRLGGVVHQAEGFAVSQ